MTAAFLAGPLGFEPRQSAPKALDLPLVDGPVNRIADGRLSIVDCSPAGHSNCQSTIKNQQSKILGHHDLCGDSRSNYGEASSACNATFTPGPSASSTSAAAA